MAKTQKMKFKAGKAKSTKKIKENSKKGANYGNMLWITADSSKTVRMLVEPKDWDEYQFVVVEQTDDGKKLGFKGKLPLFEGVEEQVPEAGRMNPRVGYVIPVVVIEDGKPQDRVMFWEPGKKMLNELLTIFEKRKTLTDRDVEIIREGSGRDTTYTLYWEDQKKRSKVMAMLDDAPEFAEELVSMVNDFMALYEADGDGDDDDEDERPSKKSKKKKGKSAAAKKRAMVDDDDDEDDDDDSSEEDDDDEESEEEADDEGDDDDDDDEEGDDDDDEVTAEDIDDMEFDDLKALAKKLGVEVKKGTKTSGFKKALKAHLEAAAEADDDEDDDDDDDENEGGSDALTGTFEVTEIDADAFTIDLTHVETGEALETVYLDRSRDDIDALEVGGKYVTTVEKDDEDDWTTMSPMKPAAAKAKKAKSKKK